MPFLLMAVGAATLAILVVMLVSLVRQVRRLAGALGDFSSAVNPVLQDIQREAERARATSESIAERQRAGLQERGRRRRRKGSSRRGRR